MARITVEDCLEVVDNRFELVLMATKRARQLSKGAEPVVMFRRVGDPAFYYGHTLKALLKQRGIHVSGLVELDRIGRQNPIAEATGTSNDRN